MMVIPNRGRLVAVMLALALAGGLLTLALLAKPSQAQGKGDQVQRFPIEFPIGPTDCIDELIDVTGTMQLEAAPIGQGQRTGRSSQR